MPVVARARRAARFRDLVLEEVGRLEADNPSNIGREIRGLRESIPFWSHLIHWNLLAAETQPPEAAHRVRRPLPGEWELDKAICHAQALARGSGRAWTFRAGLSPSRLAAHCSGLACPGGWE